jgi:hypothetical protein
MNTYKESDVQRYHCYCCDVTFKEPFPDHYDVTPCLACDCNALNILFALPEDLDEQYR